MDLRGCARSGRASRRPARLRVAGQHLPRGPGPAGPGPRGAPRAPAGGPLRDRELASADRKRVVEGKSVSVRVDIGVRRNIQKKNRHKTNNTTLNELYRP